MRFPLVSSSIMCGTVLGPTLVHAQKCERYVIQALSPTDQGMLAGRQDAKPVMIAGGGSVVAATLLGAWVQDDSGPVQVSRKRYHFKPDGSYEFVFTSRPTGSLEQKVLAREEGAFAAEANRLTMSPKTGHARSFPWRIEKDPYVGDLRLILVLPDSMLDIYYRE